MFDRTRKRIFLNGENDTFSGGQNEEKFSVLLDAHDSNNKDVYRQKMIILLLFHY